MGNLAKTASSGDNLKTLQELRDRLAVTIDETKSARDLAALSKQLTDVLSQIEIAKGNSPNQEVTTLDIIVRKREERKSPKKTQKTNKAAPGKSRAKNKPDS